MTSHERWLIRVLAEATRIRKRMKPAKIDKPDQLRADEAIYRAAAALIEYEAYSPQPQEGS